MKYVFVSDAYVTNEMMEKAAEQCLKKEDTASFIYFGEKNRADMRNTVKAIESYKREQISVPEELFQEIADADVLVVHLCPVNRDLIDKGKKLKAILSCRGGNENIDVDYACDRNILITTNPAHNANAVAEYTIGLIICETRNIARSNKALENGIWREKFPNTLTNIRELSDMTVGIIGFGSVGRLVAKKLSSFDCKILVCDPYINECAYDYLEYNFVQMTQLLQQSDIITLHARANEYILDYEQFLQMKNTAYVINTARSVMINPAALIDALENNKIMGAAIDVFESEPTIPECYKKYDNITITNHRGGDTINSYSDSPIFAIKNYQGYLEGKHILFKYESPYR